MLSGEDAMRNRIADEYAGVLSLGRRLLAFSQKMLPEEAVKYNGEGGESVVPAVFSLYILGMKVFRGIHHLGTNCLTEPAVMLLRPLANATGELAYIIADPAQRAERAELYLANEVVQFYKWAKKCIEKESAEHFRDEVRANPETIMQNLKQRWTRQEGERRGPKGAEDRASERLTKFIKQRHWSNLNAETMLESTGAKTIYPLVYQPASGYLHGGQPSRFVGISDDGSTFRINPAVDPTNLGFVLGSSTALFVEMLDYVNRVFELQWANSIKGFRQEVATMAKQERMKVTGL